MIELGLVGKPNTGKSTFFNAATLASVPVANYPFTTIEPNVGVAYVRARCPCQDFGVRCNPRNSLCLGGTRYIPVKIIDVAGLVRGAHQGKGLGNRFLDSLRQASALLHVVDAAGSTDENGRPCPPGTHDPLEDLQFLEEEIDLWLCGILERGWKKLTRAAELRGEDLAAELARRLSGLGITEEQVRLALQRAPFDPSHPVELARELRRLSKPIMVVANKADLEPSDRNVERIRERGYTVVPVSSEAELLLRRAAERGLISYRPGDPSFRILKPEALTQEQLRALERVRRYLERRGSTGVQECLDTAVYRFLGLIAVYPVEDENKLTDREGNVLPDAFLVPKGTTARELAYRIHTELGESFLYAIDARTKRRVGEDHPLKDGDVISVVAAKGRG
ncbi:MAG: redox-regulated ATPase YchF [Hadesarchaea archaeon]|jgi:ribosome-binding ATPase YchF (GTP1/OBG family)|nr:redox-regulated ATPase YchF [Hadesarchaea archaeon]